MEFGFYLPCYWRDASYPMDRMYSDMVEQACLAERLGFKTVWIPEHHFINLESQTWRVGQGNPALAVNVNWGFQHVISTRQTPFGWVERKFDKRCANCPCGQVQVCQQTNTVAPSVRCKNLAVSVHLERQFL